MRFDGDRCVHQENIVITVEDLLRVCDCAHERRMIAETGTLSRSSTSWPAIFLYSKETLARRRHTATGC
jgi:hypothetical protein